MKEKMNKIFDLTITVIYFLIFIVMLSATVYGEEVNDVLRAGVIVILYSFGASFINISLYISKNRFDRVKRENNEFNKKFIRFSLVFLIPIFIITFFLIGFSEISDLNYMKLMIFFAMICMVSISVLTVKKIQVEKERTEKYFELKEKEIE